MFNFIKRIFNYIAIGAAVTFDSFSDRKSSNKASAVFGERLKLDEDYFDYVNPSYPIESVKLIKEFVLKTPNLSQAVKRMLTLGNTGLTWEIEGVSDSEKAKIVSEIESFLNARSGIVNKLLRQVIISGALSAEFVPSLELDKVEEIQFIPVDKVKFKKERNEAGYYSFTPYFQNSYGYQLLNPASYTYDAIETDEDSPYAIPLFLSAIPNMKASHKITENTGSLIEKWGLLGFITLIKKRPFPAAGQSKKEYEDEMMKHLVSIKKSFEENRNTGFIAAFDDTKIDHHSIASSDNSNGYEKIYRSVEEQMASGLDIDPALLGRTYSTTETYAGMAYNAFISKLNNIRTPVKKFLIKTLTFHLRAMGYNFKTLDCKWGENYAIDKTQTATAEKTFEEAKKAKIESLILLYNQGIIDNNILANELGYEKPTSQTPIAKPAPMPASGKAGLAVPFQY